VPILTVQASGTFPEDFMFSWLSTEKMVCFYVLYDMCWHVSCSLWFGWYVMCI